MKCLWIPTENERVAFKTVVAEHVIDYIFLVQNVFQSVYENAFLKTSHAQEKNVERVSKIFEVFR